MLKFKDGGGGSEKLPKVGGGGREIPKLKVGGGIIYCAVFWIGANEREEGFDNSWLTGAEGIISFC